MKKIICSLLLISTQALAIVNGVDVDEDQYPHIVRLVLSEEKIEPKQLNIDNIKRLSKCTGVAISDSQVLTAGHCAHGQNAIYQSIVFVKKIKQDTSYALIPNVETSSNYIYEEPEKATEKTIVPGCSLKPRPVTKTKTLDLAVVTFPKNTFQSFAKIDFNYKPHIGDKLTILGFGTTKNSFVNQIPAQDITTSNLHLMRNVIWRYNEQRLATLSSELESFTDVGDSGAPVFYNDKLIAIINTLEEKCETELGEDYGLTNTATLLNKPGLAD